jgi:hypothetical protein
VKNCPFLFLSFAITYRIQEKGGAMNSLINSGEFGVVEADYVADFLPEQVPVLGEVDTAEALESNSLETESIRNKIDALFTKEPQEAVITPHIPDPPEIPFIVKPISAEAQRKDFKERLRHAREVLNVERSTKLRSARVNDMAELVEVDMRAFKSVYKNYNKPDDELRAELLQKFNQRYEKLGSRWVQVLERRGKIAGFIMACPTNKKPEDFTSWEDVTDNGTLETTYDPSGRYLYVVSLSTLPDGAAIDGQDMLVANLIGKNIAENYLGYFESRMPGLKRWLLKECRAQGIRISELSPEDLSAHSERYFNTKTDAKGKQRSIDPLLRMYQDMGCEIVRLVPNAYQDALSMNFGAVCIFKNPLPEWVRKVPVLRRAIGAAVSLISHSNYLTRKLV